jgi:hypothetical protein
MEQRTRDDLLRDVLLARYEGGVWKLLTVVGLASIGIIFWLGSPALWGRPTKADTPNKVLLGRPRLVGGNTICQADGKF